MPSRLAFAIYPVKRASTTQFSTLRKMDLPITFASSHLLPGLGAVALLNLGIIASTKQTLRWRKVTRRISSGATKNVPKECLKPCNTEQSTTMAASSSRSRRSRAGLRWFRTSWAKLVQSKNDSLRWLAKNSPLSKSRSRALVRLFITSGRKTTPSSTPVISSIKSEEGEKKKSLLEHMASQLNQSPASSLDSAKTSTSLSTTNSLGSKTQIMQSPVSWPLIPQDPKTGLCSGLPLTQPVLGGSTESGPITMTGLCPVLPLKAKRGRPRKVPVKESSITSS